MISVMLCGSADSPRTEARDGNLVGTAPYDLDGELRPAGPARSRIAARAGQTSASSFQGLKLI